MIRVVAMNPSDLEDFKAVTNGLSMIENLADAWKQGQKCLYRFLSMLAILKLGCV